MKKINSLKLKNKGKGKGKHTPKRKYVKRSYARKGGIEQPMQQQQGVIGTALTDLKNNKEMFTPVYDTAVNAYDTASNIGLLYNLGGALMSTIFASLFIYGGVLIKNYYSAYTEKTTATIVSTDCFHVDKKKEKKCDVVIEYEIEGTKYKKEYRLKTNERSKQRYLKTSSSKGYSGKLLQKQEIKKKPSKKILENFLKFFLN